jgi:putative ABC transport system permease protein
MLASLLQDIRWAARRLLGSPGFTAAAVLTIGLGIGANAAIFGVAKSVLLDALPYADADRLLRIYGRLLDGTLDRGPLTAGTVSDIAERAQSFASVAAFGGLAGDAVYGSEDGPRVVKVAWVEPRYFETLGAHAALGRTFRPGDATASGLVPLSGGQEGDDTATAVVVSHAAWQRLFAGDPAVVGRTALVSGVQRTVLGVLPSDFIGLAADADFYLPFDIAPVAAHPIFARRSGWLGLVARLKPGVTQAAAEGELSAIWTQLASEHPADYSTSSLAVMPIRDALVGDTRAPLVVLLASAGFVLLVTCANLAGVLLSRALSRRREFAVRVALGAGRGRLVSQVLAESGLVGLAGGAAGILFATVALPAMHGLLSRSLPSHAALSLDGGTVLAAAFVALLVGLAFGAMPAVAVTSSDPQTVLREEARGTTETRRARTLRGALVACQLALCISLLAGAGLMGRSLLAMSSAPLGFVPEGVLTATVRLPPREYSAQEARTAFFQQFTERLRGLPGVEDVATTTSLPTDVEQRVGFAVEGVSRQGEAEPFVLFSAVSDDYFRVLRTPLLQGRVFDARDRRVAAAPPAAIINESAARRFWPLGGALGAHVRLGPDRTAPLAEVVGIVGDVRNDRAHPDPEPMVYMSSRWLSQSIARFLVRTNSDPLALARSAQRELAALDGGLVFDQPMLLTEVTGRGLASRQLPAVLIAAFGGLALLLSSIGIYALFGSMVAVREGEFAVRMALGSQPAAIARLLLWQGGIWIVAGLAGGAVGIVFVARLVRGLLYQVSPFDPVVLGLAVAVLGVCATIALLVPLRRAMRVAPADILRAQ